MSEADYEAVAQHVERALRAEADLREALRLLGEKGVTLYFDPLGPERDMERQQWTPSAEPSTETPAESRDRDTRDTRIQSPSTHSEALSACD